MDESGLLMAPLVRRTWAPRGQTPVLLQEGGARKKVSVAVALCISPRRRRLALLYQTLENEYFNNTRIAEFLEMLLRRIPGRIILLWDGGPNHKGDPIREFKERYSHRMTFEPLPPYAPMLNPVEQVWQWLKWCRLNNFAAHNAHELNRKVVARLNVIWKNQRRLRRFFQASELPMPRALIS